MAEKSRAGTRQALAKAGGVRKEAHNGAALPSELVTIADKWCRLPKKTRQALLVIVQSPQ